MSVLRRASQNTYDYDWANTERVDNLFRRILTFDTPYLEAWLHSHPAERLSDTDDGETILHLAVALDDTSVRDDAVAAILDVAPELASKVDSKRRTALHCVCAEVGGGDSVLVGSLLEINPGAARQHDAAKESPLQLALLSGSPISVVEQLLDVAPREGDRLTMEGFTGSARDQNVIHLAVQGGNPEVIELIATRFSNKVSHPDGEGDSPLHLAIWKHDHASIVSLLHACPAAADFEEWTPLHSAIATKQYTGMAETEWISALARMMEVDPECERKGDRSGWTPMHLAVVTQSPQFVVKSLLNVYPEVTAREDNDCWVPLFLAVQDPACPDNSVFALLDAAPGCASIQDADGKFALHYAAENGASPSVVARLIELNREAVTAECDEVAGKALPIHLAIEHGKVAESVSVLLDAHPDSFGVPYMKDVVYTVDNLLLLAVKSKATPAVVKVLIGRFPDAVATPNSVDGYTALHLAYDHGRELEPELFQMLIEACPSAAKAKTRFDGLLPLHVGAYLNVSAAATIALLEAFPDGPNEPDSKGSTPLYYALQDPDGPEDTIAMLEWCPEAAAGRVGERNYLHVALEMQAGLAVIQALLTAQSSLVGQCQGKKTEVEDEETGEMEEVWGSGLPLHTAVKNSAGPDIVRALLEAYGDAALCKNDFGQYPLFLALENDASPQVLRLLLDATVPEESESDLGDLTDFKEWNALHYAAASCTSTEVVQMLVEDEEIALSMGSAPGGHEGSACLPLHIAVTRIAMSEGVFKLIFDAYPDAVLETDGAQYDCLRLAAEFGRSRQAQIMIDSAENSDELASILDEYKGEYGDQPHVSLAIRQAEMDVKHNWAREHFLQATTAAIKVAAATESPLEAFFKATRAAMKVAAATESPLEVQSTPMARVSRVETTTDASSEGAASDAQPFLQSATESPRANSTADVQTNSTTPIRLAGGGPPAFETQSITTPPSVCSPKTEAQLAWINRIVCVLRNTKSSLEDEQIHARQQIHQASRANNAAALQLVAGQLVECHRRIARVDVLHSELNAVIDSHVNQFSQHATDEVLKRALAGLYRLSVGIADVDLSACINQGSNLAG